MMLPRSTRRSASAWIVNSLTLAVLVSSVWMSAQQRPSSMPQYSVTPAADANRHPVVNTGVNSAAHVVTAPTTVAITNGAIDVEALRRVAFNGTVKH